MVGLIHARDLAAWQRWQNSRQTLLRRARGAVTRRGSEGVLTIRGTAPRLLVALDSESPTSLRSLVRPLSHLPDDLPIAILAPGPATHLLPGSSVHADGDLPDAHVTLSLGHYLPIGARTQAHAVRTGAEVVVVQHGLLTPYAPPLPERAHLLSWSEADADFHVSGRDDVRRTVVGSQLLWEASQAPPAAVVDERPVWLGQLHGSELPRAALARAAEDFCRTTGARYRPHPSETDRLSRAQHRRWGRSGLELDRSRRDLAELAAPVASVFSTGVLEAAARGLPSWVHLPDPPDWVIAFWERYTMARWGDSEPTPPPSVPAREPAEQIAATLTSLLGGDPR